MDNTSTEKMEYDGSPFSDPSWYEVRQKRSASDWEVTNCYIVCTVV